MARDAVLCFARNFWTVLCGKFSVMMCAVGKGGCKKALRGFALAW